MDLGFRSQNGKTTHYVLCHALDDPPCHRLFTCPAAQNAELQFPSSLTQDQITYSLIGDDTALEFFYVDPNNGEISLKASIADDDNKRYRVRTCNGKMDLVTFVIHC